MVFSLSLINTALKSDDSFYYLNSGISIFKTWRWSLYSGKKQHSETEKLINKFIKTKYEEILV